MSTTSAFSTFRPARLLSIALLVMALALVASVLGYRWITAGDRLFDDVTGYRIKNFRAPLSAPLIGGKVITLDSLEALIETGNPLLVDVMYIDHGLKSILTLGYLGENPNRKHIPGSVWLPLLGQAKLTHETDLSYRRILAKLTDGDQGKPLVFYCLSDCWASWNAARRAISYGYTNVLWFKEGTDLWNDAGLPLEEARPFVE